MYHCLVNYPKIDSKRIIKFRNKYDPYCELVDLHITFLFPILDDIKEEDLDNHIQLIIAHWKAFPVTIEGIKKTWDHWMYLAFKKGAKNITKLHDELYTGILTPYLRTDLPFEPHIGLGSFSLEVYNINDPTYQHELDEVKYKNALKEAREFDMGYHRIIDKLVLIGCDETFTRTWNVKEYALPN